MFILERHILSFFLLVHTHVHTYLYSENPSLKLLSDQHLSGTDLQITEIFFIVGHRMDLKKKMEMWNTEKRVIYHKQTPIPEGNVPDSECHQASYLYYSMKTATSHRRTCVPCRLSLSFSRKTGSASPQGVCHTLPDLLLSQLTCRHGTSPDVVSH